MIINGGTKLKRILAVSLNPLEVTENIRRGGKEIRR
jgi:hypothetical protein